MLASRSIFKGLRGDKNTQSYDTVFYYHIAADIIKELKVLEYENPKFDDVHKIMEDSYAKKKRKLHYYDVASARIEFF